MSSISYTPDWQFTSNGIGWYKVQLSNGENTAVVQVDSLSRWKRSLCNINNPSYLKVGDIIENTRQKKKCNHTCIPFKNYTLLEKDNNFKHREVFHNANSGVLVYADRLERLLCDIPIKKIRLWYGGDITDWERLAGVIVFAEKMKNKQFFIMTSCIPVLNKTDLWLSRNHKRIPKNLYIAREYTPDTGNMYLGRFKTIRHVRGFGEEELLVWPNSKTSVFRIHENAYKLM